MLIPHHVHGNIVFELFLDHVADFHLADVASLRYMYEPKLLSFDLARLQYKN